MKKLFFTTFLFVNIFLYSQGDCPGEIICTNQNDICTNGSITDLNASNRGCLTSNEANRSYWYQFCINNSGSLQFTINPNGANNDFDWAIWGPNATCPPTINPLRCSYALVSGGSDNTGVNSINNFPQTDLTEGAGGNQWTQDIMTLSGQCYVICINNYGSGSNNFNFTFGGSATILCSALPIELLSWTVSYENNVNVLKWSTISENNSDKFIIERSQDAYIWDFLSEIKAACNSTTLKNYQIVDNNYIKGSINYYRLKQIDLDGNYKYFNIIDIDNESNKELKILKNINIFGQEVNEEYEGIYIRCYEDGSYQKKCCTIQ